MIMHYTHIWPYDPPSHASPKALSLRLEDGFSRRRGLVIVFLQSGTALLHCLGSGLHYIRVRVRLWVRLWVRVRLRLRLRLRVRVRVRLRVKG